MVEKRVADARFTLRAAMAQDFSLVVEALRLGFNYGASGQPLPSGDVVIEDILSSLREKHTRKHEHATRRRQERDREVYESFVHGDSAGEVARKHRRTTKTVRAWARGHARRNELIWPIPEPPNSLARLAEMRQALLDDIAAIDALMNKM